MTAFDSAPHTDTIQRNNLFLWPQRWKNTARAFFCSIFFSTKRHLNVRRNSNNSQQQNNSLRFPSYILCIQCGKPAGYNNSAHIWSHMVFNLLLVLQGRPLIESNSQFFSKHFFLLLNKLCWFHIMSVVNLQRVQSVSLIPYNDNWRWVPVSSQLERKSR